MKKIPLILLTILGLLVFVALVAGGWLWLMIRRPFPQVDGHITLSGLQAPVDIYRDKAGVPQIYAQSQEDLFFAEGYTHAQERFWQMEFWRHVGQGRLSEILGQDGVKIDTFIRTMGWNRISEDTLIYYQTNTPEYMSIMQAYSDGVNAYLDEHRDNMSINQTILGLVKGKWEIEPWTPLDTISWAVVMADNLSGNWSEEINRAILESKLSPEDVDILLPGYPYDSRPVIAATANLVNPPTGNSLQANHAVIDWSQVNTQIIGQQPDMGILGRGPFVGSNNWVVSGEHTNTGLPLLANDPHLGIQMPAIWYEVGLHAPGMDVVGFSFAGVPGVVIGHNNRIAWGVTNVGPDVEDLYIEKINPENRTQYEYMGEWKDMTIINETIKVNGGDDVILPVYVTQHGPIITDILSDDEKALNMQLALRWTAQEPSRILQSIIQLDQAQNYDDYREALRYWDVPAQNVIFADVDGNIAYQMPGLVPLRPQGDDGLLPMPGWTGEHEWQGWIPYEELPALYNPPQGYIVTANNAVVDKDYPYLVSIDWANGDRAQRIVTMIQERIGSGKITAEDFAQIQFDSQSLMALDYAPIWQTLTSDDPEVQKAIELLRGWDGEERRDSVPAMLFEMFFWHLRPNVLKDEVGEDLVSRATTTLFFHALASQADAKWWDDVTTTDTESRDQIVLKSLSEAIAYLKENVGGDMDSWTWGKLHTTTFPSAPLGQSGIGLIEKLVNRGPFPADGGYEIVNATSWDQKEPAVVTWHPSMRMIVDMSDFDLTKTVLPTGESGHPYNPHYDDMMPLWLNGQYNPLVFSEEKVKATAVSHLVLEP